MVVFPERDVYRPVNAIAFSEFTCAIEWVDDPYSTAVKAPWIFPSFLGKHCVVWP